MIDAKWEYRFEKTRRKFWGGFDAEAQQAELNKLGSVGWELVQVMSSRFDRRPEYMLLKRARAA